jgi:2-methylcitrate dehydratase PrpD
MSDYLDEIAQYVSECEFDDFPIDVIKRAKEVVADCLAAIAAGAQEEEVKTLTKRIVGTGNSKVATLIGAGNRTEPSKACLINGMAGTWNELDEGNRFARGHPGIHVFPAALAISEELNCSGRNLLTALVLGYEIGARIAIASKLRISMMPHGTWGTVGAAVTVGKLMGYNERTMRGLINVSSSLTLATSIRTFKEGGTVRNAYCGISGYMGILAHNLVQSGFTGEKDGLRTIFGSVVSDTFVPEEVTRDLGQRFEIVRNYFKRHACCRYNHATLDALGSIIGKLPERRIHPEDIAKVEVMTYSLAAELNDQSPANSTAAKYSIPFSVATFIVHGHARVPSFALQAVNDPVIKALAQKVTVTEDITFTAMMPEHRPSSVRITLSDGTILEGKVLSNKGDFDDPYSPAELREKYFEVTDSIWKHEIAEGLYCQVMALENVEEINQMTALIAPIVR